MPGSRDPRPRSVKATETSLKTTLAAPQGGTSLSAKATAGAETLVSLPALLAGPPAPPAAWFALGGSSPGHKDAGVQNGAVGTPAPSPEAAPGGGDGPAPAGRIHFPYFLGADLGADPAHLSVSRANSLTQGFCLQAKAWHGPHRASSLRRDLNRRLPVKRCPCSKYLQSHY